MREGAPLQWDFWRPLGAQEEAQMASFFIDGELAPEALAEVHCPLAPAGLERGGVIFSGKGPLWFFCRLIEQSAEFAWAATYDPRWNAAVVIRGDGVHRSPGELIACSPFPDRFVDAPPSADVDAPPPILCWKRDAHVVDRRQWRLAVLPTGSPMGLHPSCLRNMEFDDSTPEPVDVVVVDGIAPVWLCCWLIHQLHRRLPHAVLAVHQPQLAGDVIVSADEGTLAVGTLLPTPPGDRPPRFLALVGDPNSGKSVLARKLTQALHDRGFRVLCRDCDAAAPTSPWATANETGVQLRREFKRQRGDWRAEDVLRLVQSIEGLRRSNLDLVLLDMPGGLHAVQPPQRIPAGREPLFHAVDAFLLLEKEDSARTGWTEALTRVGAAERILLRVLPGPEPGEETSHQTLHAQDCWRIASLDRSRLTEITPAVSSLAERLAEHFHLIDANARLHSSAR